MVQEITGYNGRLAFDPSKPDGTPRKLLDISQLRTLGWQAGIPLYDGINSTYRWYVEDRESRPSLAFVAGMRPLQKRVR
jgi:GDP-L-fucose synthase